MKILALATDAYGGRGGIAKFNRELFDALAGLPDVASVRVLARHVTEPPGELPDNLVQSAFASRGRIGFAFEVARARMAGFDRVVCGHINLLPMALWIARGTIPVDLMTHGVDAWQQPQRRFRAEWLDRVDRVFAVSRLSIQRFRSWSGFPAERIHWLPNSIDLRAFSPGEPTNPIRGVPEDARVLMWLGRLDASEAYKGVDEMLVVFPELLERVPQAFFLICGDGSDRPRLERRARELGLAAHVRFTGFIPEQEKVDYFRAADAFVLAGFGEGFGIVLLEALACGLSVVASRLDGSFEAVGEGEWGAAVDPGDAQELLNAVADALECGRRQPPEGLARYSVGAFRQRVAGYFSREAESRD